MRYRFHLKCPACRKTSETTAPDRLPYPDVKCGDCLMERVEIVPMTVMQITRDKEG